jgi:hypothetical protein
MKRSTGPAGFDPYLVLMHIRMPELGGIASTGTSPSAMPATNPRFWS